MKLSLKKDLVIVPISLTYFPINSLINVYGSRLLFCKYCRIPFFTKYPYK